MNDCFDWSRNYPDFDDDDEEYQPQRDFLKDMVRIAKIPALDTDGIPNEIWESFMPANAEGTTDKLLVMVITAMTHCNQRAKPGIKLPDDTLQKHRTYDAAILYLYESALRQGFGTLTERGALLSDDLGL